MLLNQYVALVRPGARIWLNLILLISKTWYAVVRRKSAPIENHLNRRTSRKQLCCRSIPCFFPALFPSVFQEWELDLDCPELSIDLPSPSTGTSTGTLLTSWTNVWSISSKPQRSIFSVGAQPRRSRRQNLPPACTPIPILSWAASHVGSRF